MEMFRWSFQIYMYTPTIAIAGSHDSLHCWSSASSCMAVYTGQSELPVVPSLMTSAAVYPHPQFSRTPS
ncbi:hypothetical protein BCR44DRAFT_316221 [Catenaria anguillulae PL171]|uniref:Uncharacterized protein n=1 Tax=Catenaria anguillulae PL171 TaxID=765915 RepID=A0A1Y2HXI0_9FUNG|nr:hypothetical protein BCR44DRAFT_316221 [Catenaria anguillulae PL171]